MQTTLTIAQWLSEATIRLTAAGIITARLDCQLLLEDCLDISRAQLLAYPDTNLSASQQTDLQSQLDRRMHHEPMAYIRGKVEFYGHEMYVDANVLVPRPESEALISQLILLMQTQTTAEVDIIDVGTGSGALAISAKLALPLATVLGTDIDPACLVVAARNAKNYHLDIALTADDLLPARYLRKSNHIATDTANRRLILLCNLPYVPDDFPVNIAATREPKRALFGGPDGLNVYRQLFNQIKLIDDLDAKPQFILCESLPTQHTELAALALSFRYNVIAVDDFVQVFRYL